MKRILTIGSIFLSLVCLSGVIFSSNLNKGREIRVQGRILCLDDSGNVTDCSDFSNLFAILSDEQTYLFRADDSKAGIFRDSRVRERYIEVRGWLIDRNYLEIIQVFSVKENQLYEIQYFCSVCNIKAFVGGVCWCCQEDFEFREVPMTN